MKSKKIEPTYKIELTEKELEILEFVACFLHTFTERIRDDEEITKDFESLSKNDQKIGF